MRAFARENKNDSPSFSLYMTNGIIQLFLIVIFFNDSTYQAFYGLSTLMIMVPYLFSGLYYAKVAFRKEGLEQSSASQVAWARFFGILGSVYGFWMLYSSGLYMLLVTTVLYAPGIIVYALGKRENGKKVFEKKYEVVIAIALVALAILSLVLIVRGTINPF